MKNKLLNSRNNIDNVYPGLIAMRGDLCSEDGGFESQHHILGGHFATFISCKNWNVCLKRLNINEEEARDGPFLKHWAHGAPQQNQTWYGHDDSDGFCHCANYQCDQIGRFIGLWTTFQSLWQQFICPNVLHSKAIFVKVSKSLILLVKSFLGKFKDIWRFFTGHTASNSGQS